MLKLALISVIAILIPGIYGDEIESFRLPNTTRPEKYMLSLTFDNFEANLQFTGEVLIKIKVEDETDKITLHSAVNIESAKVCVDEFASSCSVSIEVTSSCDVEREFCHFTASETLKPGGDYSLSITFSAAIATMTNNVSGVYRGSYEEGASTQYFLASHMQATHARKIFPCYDEPKFKAIFYLNLIHSDQYHSISNVKATDTQPLGGDQMLTSFDWTPLLPTYLLAFVISKFANKSETSNGIEFRAFSRENKIEHTDFGIKTAIKALEHFEMSFNVTYEEMIKLDQVAFPVFSYGGMENHGIFFYSEDFFLYDDEVDTAYDRDYVAQIVVHEVCHTFLGNLLTPHWWSVLWLSEGFCKFYEYYMLQAIYPDMRMEELFAVEALQSVMVSDASPSIRPMTFDVETPNEIHSIFDSVAYRKSASVIRMFLYALTPAIFHDGLHIYLSKSTSNPEGVAEPSHLYEALQEAAHESGINIKELFESWEHQAGFPYLTVERNYNGNQVRVTQQRFLSSGHDNTSLWHIPITYSTNTKDLTVVNSLWFGARHKEFTLEGLRPNHILIANIDQHGYYRVQYDVSNWMQIAKYLYEGNSQISPNTRAMLIDDAAAFADNDMLDIRIFFEIVKHLEKDDDWIPWITATDHLSLVRRMLNDGSSKLYDDFRKFLRKILEKTYNSYGSDVKSDEPYHHRFIRNIAIDWACQAHLPECLSDTSTLFQQAIDDPDFTLPLDHKSEIMCYGVVNSDYGVYERLWDLYGNTSDVLILQTIGCMENEEILTNFIRNYQNASESHWLTIIQAVYENGPIGMKVAINFLNEHFDEFFEFISNGNFQSSLNSIFTELADLVTTEAQLDDLQVLMTKYQVSDTTKSSAIETMDYNLNWIGTYSAKIQEFLDDYLRDSANKLATTWLITAMMIAVKLFN